MPPFLSTLSLRRATAIGRQGTDGRDNFYPRSPCGERPGWTQTRMTANIFLSTLSLRRATAVPTLQPWHAANFYPRSPCGERLSKRRLPSSCRLFLSTLSLRRATAGVWRDMDLEIISIHALLAESDGRASV